MIYLSGIDELMWCVHCSLSVWASAITLMRYVLVVYVLNSPVISCAAENRGDPSEMPKIETLPSSPPYTVNKRATRGEFLAGVCVTPVIIKIVWMNIKSNRC